MIHAYAAQAPGGKLTPFEYDPGPLGPDEVELQVSHCGVCHSDLSMLDDEWRQSAYPLVPGHEVIGLVRARGERVEHLSLGQTVGLGWMSASCMTCPQCMAGDHNLCQRSEATIVRRHGGFADRVRCSATWALPLPEGLDAADAGPLFCGGSTVFNPFLELDIKPTDHVGVVGIGGLGHLALQFANKWGCEVTAFTSSEDKRDEAIALGAHHVVGSRDVGALKARAGTFDVILSTVNVSLDWPSYVLALRPRGRLHSVGAVDAPIAIPAFRLIGGQKSLSGSPVGSPETVRKMLEFCARHGIAARTEHFPMRRVNDAMERLRSGEARYRVVLDAEG